jgi:hypothetical protein
MKSRHIAEAVPFEDFIANASRIFEETDADGDRRMLVERGGSVFAVRIKRKTAAGRRLEERERLLNLVGIGESAEPTDIAAHKDEYIADAYMPSRHSEQ